jgi:transposase, IS30 family
MSNDNHNNKNVYKHLLPEEREFIAIKIDQKWSLRKIAAFLGRSPSTISREIKKNAAPIYNVRYSASSAEKRAKERWFTSHKKERLKNPRLRRIVIELLKRYWSPELIAGRINRLLKTTVVNYESIYLYIYHDAPELCKYLIFGHKKRKKRNPYSKKHCNRITNRISIEERPKSVNNRKIVGHWEVDTAVSKQSISALAVMIERKTRLVKIEKINAKTSENMHNAIVKRLGKTGKLQRLSITYDNGLENARHELTNNSLGTQSYFCNPYHSWEKGSVENVIGITRWFLPKKTDFGKIDNKYIQAIESYINNRPKKCLGYLTPLEAFRKK